MTDLSKVKIRFTNSDGAGNDFETTSDCIAVPDEMLSTLNDWRSTGDYRCVEYDPLDNSYCFTPMTRESHLDYWWLHVDDCIVE